MSVWLSTTMIQALRNLVDLFTFYFDVLSRLLDKLLDLLCECICQGKVSRRKFTPLRHHSTYSPS